ncbi:sensor histidine kinase [Bacteroides neonati]|uniref:sensor histidine kinase n=1 Tax=Bacteroides neonati TaxID=1347393 RepID=UPI0004B28382|nr:ATP-binding protein [Bacteroides neonati]
MKRYAVLVTIHIILITTFSITAYVLCEKQLWFSSLLAIVLLIATGIDLYLMQMKQTAMMHRLVDSIRFNDLTQTFQPPFRDRSMRELAEELSQVIKSFRSQLLDEEVKHQFYENLLNKVDTAVLVADRNGCVLWMNQAATTQLGQEPQLPAELLKVPIREAQVIGIHRNGVLQEMAISSTLFVAQGKEQLLINLKNIHSVLERNEMEAWQKLIRVLTHEIMNSITPIISLSDTLTERSASQSMNENEYRIMLQAMQTIHRRSKGLLDFVENYRRLTRIPRPVCTYVNGNELLSDLQKLFMEADIRFQLPEEELTLYIDRAQIEQIVINLIKNAREACIRISHPEITVNLAKDAFGSIVLTVRDNGEGILPEVMDKIFVPFFTTKTTGSGIGLSLCKQLMNLHGGTITACSEKGKGSCFTLTFPHHA